MVIVKLTGGLGNQLFQYAAGRSLSLRLSTQLLLDTSYYLLVRNRRYILDRFNIEGRKTFPGEVQMRSVFSRYSLLKEVKYFSFDPTFLTVEGNVYLDGWWQNSTYFDTCWSVIHKELSFKKEKKLHISKNSVAIHVRRGDYTNLSGFGICSPQYYKKAISRLQKVVKQPIYYVFSDDIVWTRKHLYFIPNPIFVSGQTEIDDFYQMSRCTHHIIANSTFSWWTSALAVTQKGITIAPTPWVNYEKKETKALYPKNWIIVPRN